MPPGDYLSTVIANLHVRGVPMNQEMIRSVAFLFDTDYLGRDLFYRNLYAARVSLTIGLVAGLISFVLGCALGGISGY